MKIISSKKVYDCGLFQVTEDSAKGPDGFELKRSIVRHAGSAVILAEQKNSILLVRQYRLPAEKYLWEIPAGRLDPGETPLKAAKRELQEETGFRAKTWKKLVSWYASPGYVAEKMTLFLATDLMEGEASPMDDERIETRWFKSRHIDDMARAGKIDDGKTLLAYLYWKRIGR